MENISDWPCGNESASGGWTQGPSTGYCFLSPQRRCHSQLFGGLYSQGVADPRGGTDPESDRACRRTGLPHQACLHRHLASLCSKHSSQCWYGEYLRKILFLTFTMLGVRK